MRSALPTLLLLTACAPTLTVNAADTPPMNLGGAAPDVVILSVAGRCGVPCAAPRDNWAYLGSRGTVDRVAREFQAAGLRVQAANYASSPAERFVSARTRTEQRGYAALLADLDALRAAWPGPDAPRIVLLGHSQGVVWLHQLTRDRPDVPFAAQIDLDGICLGWKTDFGPLVHATDPFSPLSACEPMTVAGRRVNAKDVVWPNVARGIEVQSKRLPRRGAATGFAVNYLFEVEGNVRLDGTTRALTRFISPREDHSAVTYPASDAMTWVAGQLRALTLEWAAQAARGPAGTASP
ncbi:hypothetical protein [Deinococcus soli (ex Cha et al. 2016)]|uniref:Serine aminopeptidase S33 domain-containing protein n=2 Tax=Deinococcus soli (ex Cha et al. 2016) TaxID=1309411 RepID=A0AAE3XCP8_9DEIO|nr:hypothetical protein [Deinococcus soli (ex Cha et al. 2016)]MDR6217615.1 hypothetical protein [Deinococcus soli (ex Cha et al. 2016)]MDR6326924.1 hypothetical protein [Deinococcus soli (ex Cha et al. 2016)]MDR6750350.1 hypothetical protein [Deinococcus soli (ex Cha et al. 2016)]